MHRANKKQLVTIGKVPTVLSLEHLRPLWKWKTFSAALQYYKRRCGLVLKTE